MGDRAVLSESYGAVILDYTQFSNKTELKTIPKPIVTHFYSKYVIIENIIILNKRLQNLHEFRLGTTWSVF